MLDTASRLFPGDFPRLSRNRLTTLQVNLGYLCNQTCQHCHVDAGPKRKEVMTAETITQILKFLENQQIATLDLTGGAPELNPGFRQLVKAARRLGVHVIDRCNLTILEEPGQEGLAEFLAEQKVEVIASLPCYQSENVNEQRGKGVFEKSIAALRRLNVLGYGSRDAALELNLVFNPLGPVLPPDQLLLEKDYQQQLHDAHGIRFNRLFTIVNMPIKRFGSMLASRQEFDSYLGLLKSAHQETNLPSVMCRQLVSLDWQGFVYDCDFNQMLGLPLRTSGSERLHISELLAVDLQDREIHVGDHCYGCTAGQGSSCGGALA